MQTDNIIPHGGVFALAQSVLSLRLSQAVMSRRITSAVAAQTMTEKMAVMARMTTESLASDLLKQMPDEWFYTA